MISFCMLKRYLPSILLLTMLMACSKGKLNTRPSITIKNINTTEVFPGTDLIFTLDYRDKEGDLGNGRATYIRKRLNIKPIPDAASNDKIDTVTNSIPDFPKTTSGEIRITVPNSLLNEDPFDNDTMVFKIFVTDVAGNISDTLTSPTIVERQN
jgi:hypothetical protein